VLLRAGDLRFGYTPARLVIDDVSLDLAEGTAVGILGPNGSGKTTLMRLLSGGLTPQTGVVRLDGVDVRSFRPTALARRIAVVPQETSLAFDYTALEIVLMGRYPHLSAFEVEGPHDLAIADAALESTGTRALAERAFRSLSGGEKQRVIIASALAQTANGEGAGHKHHGPFTQVSRLGNPLFNEVIVPIGAKDRWNRLAPQWDNQFAKYVAHPELAKLLLDLKALEQLLQERATLILHDDMAPLNILKSKEPAGPQK